MNPRSNILLELIGKGWEQVGVLFSNSDHHSLIHQRIITALDSALNEWVDNIPSHRLWCIACSLDEVSQFCSQMGSQPHGSGLRPPIGLHVRGIL